jgi:hypothetical protein
MSEFLCQDARPWHARSSPSHLYFGDTRFARGFIPRIDGILDFFDAHVDELGLVLCQDARPWHARSSPSQRIARRRQVVR